MNDNFAPVTFLITQNKYGRMVPSEFSSQLRRPSNTCHSVAAFLSENVRSDTIQIFIQEVRESVEKRAHEIAHHPTLPALIADWSAENGPCHSDCRLFRLISSISKTSGVVFGGRQISVRSVEASEGGEEDRTSEERIYREGGFQASPLDDRQGGFREESDTTRFIFHLHHSLLR